MSDQGKWNQLWAKECHAGSSLKRHDKTLTSLLQSYLSPAMLGLFGKRSWPSCPSSQVERQIS